MKLEQTIVVYPVCFRVKKIYDPVGTIAIYLVISDHVQNVKFPSDILVIVKELENIYRVGKHMRRSYLLNFVPVELNVLGN
jgi:hypothetical protein